MEAFLASRALRISGACSAAFTVRCTPAFTATYFAATLSLVRADDPPGVALLAHVSVMRGATAAGLGLAVRTLAHVRCKRMREQLCEQTQTDDNNTLAM